VKKNTTRQCSSKTKIGRRCRAWAISDTSSCLFHSLKHKEIVERARRRGGIESHRRKSAISVPIRPLNSIENVDSAIEDIHVALASGRLDVSRANALLKVLALKVNSIDSRNLEERIGVLEQENRT